MPSSFPGPLKSGDIWFAPKVQSPHNEWEDKDRRVLIVYPNAPCSASGGRLPVYAVAISTKPRAEDLRRNLVVQLPNAPDYPDSKTSLTQPSWAIGTWLIQGNPCHFDSKVGFLDSNDLDLLNRVREIIRNNATKPQLPQRCDLPVRCWYCQ